MALFIFFLGLSKAPNTPMKSSPYETKIGVELIANSMASLDGSMPFSVINLRLPARTSLPSTSVDVPLATTVSIGPCLGICTPNSLPYSNTQYDNGWEEVSSAAQA